MSAKSSSRLNNFFVRIGLLIGVSTLFLTASFIGIVAFLAGEVTNVSARLPWYIVAGALSFVASIVLLEAQDSNGRTIIVTAIVVTSVFFVVVLLGIEGFLFAQAKPELVFNSQLILYFLAASLVGVGVGYWGLKHWREFTAQGGQNRL